MAVRHKAPRIEQVFDETDHGYDGTPYSDLFLGVVIPIRAGLSGVRDLTTLQTNWRQSACVTMRVVFFSASTPVMTNTCQEGAKISSTRIFSLPALRKTTSSSSGLS